MWGKGWPQACGPVLEDVCKPVVGDQGLSGQQPLWLLSLLPREMLPLQAAQIPRMPEPRGIVLKGDGPRPLDKDPATRGAAAAALSLPSQFVGGPCVPGLIVSTFLASVS